VGEDRLEAIHSSREGADAKDSSPRGVQNQKLLAASDKLANGIGAP
jgi:hypothetical protein